MTWSHVAWYTARAGGYTALVLLTASIVIGLVLSLRVSSPSWPRFLTNDLHQHVTLVAPVFAALHGVAVLLDPYMRYGWADVLVPLASPYRPAGMALGIVGLYLWLAVWLSSRFRRTIGYAMWRRIHYAAFAVYALVLAHTVLTGTDAGGSWAQAIEATGLVAIVSLTAVRLVRAGERRTPAPADLRA